MSKKIIYCSEITNVFLLNISPSMTGMQMNLTIEITPTANYTAQNILALSHKLKVKFLHIRLPILAK